jgi:hypothetical protein
MRFKVVFWPMLDRTFAIVSTLHEGRGSGWESHQQYDLKTKGTDPWPLADLLRELADQMDASQF